MYPRDSPRELNPVYQLMTFEVETLSIRYLHEKLYEVELAVGIGSSVSGGKLYSSTSVLALGGGRGLVPSR